ncbi:Gfo/Idh/MocA family oxidoreductase [Jeotgalibacillus sp. S-D1]|uniref:Gfo/Idh/MocA family protein n=1 Tax=Jeotgalibacillus sp. S-D1 TaxID=2552189 RepID=UPI001059A4C9|nr:Gfo/Idh/MocA family oxidoreductase [Jeotgalibacillus sp. S-D1]TDL33127.1 Gfo/Idh/MocA family oxidoreductase [Jeotgalibacillus sp. S-D1]
MNKMRVGIIGAGNISDIYLAAPSKFKNIELAGIADLLSHKAKEKADLFNIQFYETPAALMEDPSIEVIVNLTIPSAHAEINLAALDHGKHVYSEKPLATRYEDGKKIIEKAKALNLRVGVAPDTILGAGVQTALQLVNNDKIGKIVGAKAFMMGSGPEGWHPNPAFFYETGAGPLFDMGPYYLSSLLVLLGPVDCVTGIAQTTYRERTIKSLERAGETFPVTTPTHVEGLMHFKSNVTASITATFDIHQSKLPFIEVYGSKGTIHVPDPNFFGGPVTYLAEGEDGWQDAELVSDYIGNERGLGLSDMIASIYSNEQHYCHGELGLHVLEVMEKLLESSVERTFKPIETNFAMRNQREKV